MQCSDNSMRYNASVPRYLPSCVAFFPFPGRAGLALARERGRFSVASVVLVIILEVGYDDTNSRVYAEPGAFDSLEPPSADLGRYLVPTRTY